MRKYEIDIKFKTNAGDVVLTLKAEGDFWAVHEAAGRIAEKLGADSFESTTWREPDLPGGGPDLEGGRY